MSQLTERIVEIRIGPSGGEGRSWKNPAYIEFEVERTTGRNPNKATVKMYNLSLASRQWIEQPNQTMQILAGEGIPGQIFFGDIHKKGVKTKPQNENTITEIKASDGQRKWRDSIFSKSYPPNITRSVILKDVIAAIGLSTGYIATIPEKRYSNGYAGVGWARDILTDILGNDAEWSIQAGSLQIVTKGDQIPGNAVVIKPSTGMIGSPERTDKGVNVKTIFTREIVPAGPVTIEGNLFQGDLRVTKVVHKGNSQGLVWETAVKGMPLS